jgi:SAM-dependent methyltransferase
LRPETCAWVRRVTDDTIWLENAFFTRQCVCPGTVSVRSLSLGSDGTRVEHVHEHKRFDDEAATWDDDPGHEKRQLAVAEAIKEAVNLSPRMSAVDVGGGTGRLSILLADLVGSVVVTDPSAGMVQVTRERIEAAGLSGRLRAVQADLSTDRLDGAYDVVWSSLALHHVQNLDQLLRSVAGLLVNGGRLLIADLDEDPDGAFHADKVDFDGRHGFGRQRLTEQLSRAGFGDVSFVDATTILKNDREFGVFLCTATKVHERSGDH